MTVPLSLVFLGAALLALVATPALSSPIPRRDTAAGGAGGVVSINLGLQRLDMDYDVDGNYELQKVDDDGASLGVDAGVYLDLKRRVDARFEGHQVAYADFGN